MSLTCVSCFYEVPNKHGNKFYEWFKNTLSINCPYVIFTTENLVSMLQQYRHGLPTYFIICPITEFYTFQYKDRMVTHPIHCPSVELNLIWNEKMNMMKKAHDINIFKSDWFMWVDAGICVFRNRSPPSRSISNLPKLEKLPKNKLIYTSSEPYVEKYVRSNSYYHHVSGTFMMHSNMLSDFVDLYYESLNNLLSHANIWTDQVILTHIYKGQPELFYKIADGYGVILHFLYA